MGFTPENENLERIARSEMPDTRPAIEHERGVHVLFDERARGGGPA